MDDNKQPVAFQYLVIWDPTDNQQDEGDVSKIIVEPAIVLARSEEVAFLHAARAVPDLYIDQLDQCRVVVRPF